MKRSILVSQMSGSSQSLLSLIRHYPLCFYFLITFALTWTLDGLFLGVLHTVTLVGILTPFLGPALSAFILLGLTEGKVGVLRLLRRFLLYRVPLRWYFFVLIVVPVLALFGTLLVPGALSAFQAPDSTFALGYLIIFIEILLVGGPLGEETGWRGFALPRMQQRLGPLVGSLVLGGLWGLWHLPLLIFVPGYNGSAGGLGGTIIAFALFVISTTALTVIFTWVFNNVRGSLLLTILLHTSINAPSDALAKLFPSLSTSFLFTLIPSVCFVGVALLVIVVTRGRLSYDHFQSGMEHLAPEDLVE